MKIIKAIVSLVIVSGLMSCGSRPGQTPVGAGSDLLCRIHSCGTVKLQATPQAVKMQQIGALPSGVELKANIARKMAANFSQVFNTGALPADHKPAIEALAQDAMQYECFLEVQGEGAKRCGLVAVVLPEVRRTVWQQTVARLVSGGARLAFVQEGPWTVTALGDAAQTQVTQFQQKVKTNAFQALKSDQWMTLMLNLPQMSTLLGWQGKAELPFLDLSAGFKGDDVRITGTLDFPSDYKWQPESWKPPKSIINETITSFCAANGVADWLGRLKLTQDLKINDVPNQLFGWGQSGMPLLTYAAFPQKNATNTVGSLSKDLPMLLLGANGEKGNGNILWASNRAEILWQGLPMAAPHAKAVSIPEGQYIVAGLFPAPSKGKPAPAELFATLAKNPKLVYYEWEITEDRLRSWIQFMQLLPLFSSVRQIPVNQPAAKWLQDVAPKLGNIGTEVTAETPRQLKFVRTGHVGLTALELTLFCRCLDLWEMPADFGVLKKTGSKKAPSKTN